MMGRLFFNVTIRLIFVIFGAVAGLFFGTGIGIVGTFGGVSGATVFPLIGGAMGFLATPDIIRFGKYVGRIFRKGTE